jgi:uncharacterized membrane protein YvbJ
MYCQSCGASLSDGSVYCHKCGTKYEEPKKEDPPAPAPEADPTANDAAALLVALLALLTITIYFIFYLDVLG